MKSWHNNLLSAQKSMASEGWLALVDAQENADPMAAASSSLGVGERNPFGFDGSNHFRLDWGSSSDNCFCAPVFCPSTSGSIGIDGVINLVRSNGGDTASTL